MKKGRVIEIQSFNDIITNSSTEIYSSDSNKNLIKTLNELKIDYFSPSNIDDVLNVIKRTVGKVFKDPNFLYEVELGMNRTGDRVQENRKLPRLTSEGYKKLIKLGYCDEKIKEFFDPIYRERGVYGKVYIIYYDHMSLGNLFGPTHKRTASKFEWLGID